MFRRFILPFFGNLVERLGCGGKKRPLRSGTFGFALRREDFAPGQMPACDSRLKANLNHGGSSSKLSATPLLETQSHSIGSREGRAFRVRQTSPVNRRSVAAAEGQCFWH